MIEKIKSRFDKLDKVSTHILKYGMQLACLLVLAGLILYLMNIYSTDYSIYQSALSKHIVEAAVTIAAEIIIGGLMFDYFSKKYSED
ncbi:MAG: hypothetical protein BWY15_01309 [Firmicutes bacterium ADurb.Bin193]|nr:MAG: hypothetical protein BWY15_01309 [Firmicutes bacterium ADurb.Bin193]